MIGNTEGNEIIRFYIETDRASDKMSYMVENHDAELIEQPLSFEEIDDSQGLLCSICNGAWDALAYCPCADTFDVFTDPSDPRRRTWATMDKAKAKELSNCPF